MTERAGDRKAWAAGTRISIATYNVHGCVGTDGRRDVARIARVVQELHADVIALQEVDVRSDPCASSEPLELLAHLPGYQAVCARTRRSTRGEFGNALLSRLPPLRVQALDLSYPHARCEPRGALDVCFDVGGVPLRVIATHLGLRPRERRHQVRRILAEVDRDETTATVLLGDINEWFMTGRPLRWLHAEFGYASSVGSFPSFLPVLALDRIWAHPPHVLSRVRAHRSPAARRASDHLPVLADLELRAVRAP